MLKDTFSKKIEDSLKSNKNDMKKNILSYIDKYSNVLYSSDLTAKIYFSDEDRAIIYSNLGILESEIENAVNDSKDINKSFKVSSNSFYIICTLAIRQTILDNNKDLTNLIAIYMSCMMYSSMHSRFLQYKANKAIMDYTINNLDNNFKFKKLGTLFALLEDNVVTWINTYDSRFKSGTDNDLIYVINALQTRIKGKLKKIFNEFYKNWESGKYLNTDSSNYGEDVYKEVDNNSYVAARLADKIYLNLIQKGINTKLLKYAITRSDTSIAKLQPIVEDVIKNDDNNDIQKIILMLIDYYIRTSGNSTDSIYKGEFVTYMMNAYTSNTEAEQIKYTKNKIEEWVNDNASRYGMKRYGKTAMASYKKSFYMFLIYTINLNSKMN